MWGTIAALFTVTIWGGWIVATRFGVTSNLSPVEIAILRTAPPGLILLPVFLRIPWRGVRWRYIAALIGGAGAPFLLVVSTGMQFAPTADIGALLPGTMPLFVALFAFMLLGERFDRWRLAGFVLIIAGGLAVGGMSLFAGDPGAWRGHVLFLCGASMWAIYTIGLRQSGLDAWQAAAVVNTGSMILVVPASVDLWRFAIRCAGARHRRADWRARHSVGASCHGGVRDCDPPSGRVECRGVQRADAGDRHARSRCRCWRSCRRP